MVTYRMSLDVQSASSQIQLVAKKRDNGTRKIVAMLTSNGLPYVLNDDCTVVFTATKPDGNVLYNSCSVENGKIVYNLTEQTTASDGIVKCEFKVYGKNSTLLTCPRFEILVDNTVYDDGDEVESSSEYSALTKLISEANELVEEVETKLQNGDFVGPPGPSGPPGEQVQSDWNQTNKSALDYIKNKPTIPTVPMVIHVMSDYTNWETNTLPDPMEWFVAHPARGSRYDTYPGLSEPILWLDNSGEWTFYIVQYDYAEMDVDNVLESAEWAELEFAKVSDIPKVDSRYGLSMDYNKNIRVSPATDSVILEATEKYKPVTPYYLGYGVGCHGIARLSTMPSAASKYLGWIALYTGETDATYTNNSLYTCVNDGGYKWIDFSLSQIGDIESALDSIIAIQNALMGGDA